MKPEPSWQLQVRDPVQKGSHLALREDHRQYPALHPERPCTWGWATPSRPPQNPTEQAQKWLLMPLLHPEDLLTIISISNLE